MEKHRLWHGQCHPQAQSAAVQTGTALWENNMVLGNKYPRKCIFFEAVPLQEEGFILKEKTQKNNAG